jgi:DNA primase
MLSNPHNLGPSQRKLRLSMIHSAQVFSPRPSADPRENLRILKSPLKNAFKTPAKSELSTPTRNNIFSAAQTPTKYGHSSNEEEEEADDIVLVDGNHPRVVEDEKDLVILEDVEPPNSPSHSTPVQQYQPPQQVQQPPQTPARKRSLSRNTLHRAVLIRSAQRAVLQAEHAEREREEEEEEEMEVLETVANEAASESEEDDPENEAVSDANDEDGEGETDEEGEEEYEEEMRGREEERDPDAQKSTWRKSLERIWPFRSSSAPVEEDDQDVSFSYFIKSALN